MKESINIMQNRIVDILRDNKPTIYLYGSAALDDFKQGWSDIDILCLTEATITDAQANKLVNLRQTLLEEYCGNKYFRSFEGGFLSTESFFSKTPDCVVYWGTSGQRITDSYSLNNFSVAILIDSGILLHGKDIREGLNYPTFGEFFNDIMYHYKTIRKHAFKTSRSIYAVGWMLDIARALYTLQTGRIASKTGAGEWALEHKLCPDTDVLEKVVEIRREPEKYKHDESVLDWAENLGRYIQRFADVLERELLTRR